MLFADDAAMQSAFVRRVCAGGFQDVWLDFDRVAGAQGGHEGFYFLCGQRAAIGAAHARQAWGVLGYFRTFHFFDAENTITITFQRRADVSRQGLRVGREDGGAL